MWEELAQALAEERWGPALERALELWRATRAGSLVALIDAIAKRCTPPELPRASVIPRWWIASAKVYEPIKTAQLIEQFETAIDRGVDWATIRARYRNASNPILYAVILGSEFTMERHQSLGVLDRLAAIAHWPDDPRVARLLVHVIAALPLDWNLGALQGLYTVCGDWIVRIGDATVRPLLEVCAAEPRGSTPEVRHLQQDHAVRVLAALPAQPASDFDPDALAWCTRLDRNPAPEPRREADEAALWDQIADAPDDDAPRMILADLLVQRGDRRGELITLQCAGQVHRAKRLIDDHWRTWLGDLELVVTHDGTEFERGMLASVRLGQASTPEWAYRKSHGHRELAVVRTVRRAHASPAQYADFIAALRRLPDHLQINTPELLVPLRGVAARWPTRKLEYSEHDLNVRTADKHLPEHDFEQLAQMFPDLDTIQLALWRGFDAVRSRAALVAGLPVLFPRLRRIVIDLAGIRRYEPGARDELQAVGALPLVEWLDPRQLPM